jgi:hypothetical protein
MGRDFAFAKLESWRSGSISDEGRATARLLPDADHQANGRSGRKAGGENFSNRVIGNFGTKIQSRA